jgi:hypothetical protein
MGKSGLVYTGGTKYLDGYQCQWCNRNGRQRQDHFRDHIKTFHPDIDPKVVERYMTETRYPDLDLDAIVERYRNSLETMIGLQYKGWFIKKYLKTIGALRSPQADKRLMYVLSMLPADATREDVRQFHTDHLINHFLKCSPDVRFNSLLNGHIDSLIKRGHEDLIPMVKAKRIIEYARKKMHATIELAKTEE